MLGLGQFLVVWGGWVGFGVAVVYACGGLTRALMRSLLNVTSWSSWQPWAPFSVDDITDGTVATVLGLMGLLLWLAAIGHLLVMITRSAALIVLAATTPVAAAGLVSDAGRTWFWKSLRWFLAAAFTPVLMVLMLGIGVQITTGVANGLAEETAAGHRHRTARGDLDPDRLRRPGRLVQAAGVRRPEHQLRRRAAHRAGRGRRCAADCSAAATLPTPAAGGDAGDDGRSQGEAASEDATDTRLQHAAGRAAPHGRRPCRRCRSLRAGSRLRLRVPGHRHRLRPHQPDGSRAHELPPRPHAGTAAAPDGRHAPTPTTPATTARRRRSRTIRACPVTRGRQSPRQTRPRRHQHRPRHDGGGLGGGAGRGRRDPRAARWRRGCSRRPDRPRLGRRFWYRMSMTYNDYNRDRIGWFFGLSGWQLAVLAASALPVFVCLQRGAWSAALLFALGWVLVMIITVVPVRGRSATGWFLASVGVRGRRADRLDPVAQPGIASAGSRSRPRRTCPGCCRVWRSTTGRRRGLR